METNKKLSLSEFQDKMEEWFESSGDITIIDKVKKDKLRRWAKKDVNLLIHIITIYAEKLSDKNN